MTLTAPSWIVPGTCDCTPDGCTYTARDAVERMTLACEAKLRADEAESRGDHAAVARHRADQRRHSAAVQRIHAIPPATLGRRTNMDDGERRQTIATIRQTLAELLHQPDAAEDLDRSTDAYLVARRDSLLELRERAGTQRADALRRGDAASVLRFDAVATDSELCSARARVFNSGVPETEREAVAQRLAHCAAWQRCRETVLAEAVQTRMDSLDEHALVPTDRERARARQELEARQPPPGSAQRADAFAAAEHSSLVESRAKALAARRIAEEHRARLLATLPAPPPMPRLPPVELPNARAAPEPLWPPKNGARRGR